MDTAQGSGAVRLGRAVPAAAVVGMVAAVLAGGSPARAAWHGGLVARPAGAAVAGGISTVAGGPGAGQGRGVAVEPCSVSFADGEAYIADGGIPGDGIGAAVRMVGPQTGRLTTVAGTGSAGPLGDGGPAASAFVQTCQGSNIRGGGEVAVDHAGDLVIADEGGDRIRVVARRSGTVYGQPVTAGDIYTVAGTGTGGFSGDRGPATAAELQNPQGVAVDHAGNLLIADTGNNRIRVVAAATGTFYGQPMTAGDIYTLTGTGAGGFSGDRGPAAAAELNSPATVTVDHSYNLVIADTLNSRIRVMAHRTGTFYGQAMKAGHIYTVAGDGARGFSGDGRLATRTGLNYPGCVAVDGAGNLVIADTANYRIRVVAASTAAFYGLPMTAGDIYTIAGNGSGTGATGDGGPAVSAPVNPQGLAIDAAGNVLIADAYNARVRAVAASTGTFDGQPMTAGNIYTIAGTGTVGFSGDGGPATAAEFTTTEGVAVDRQGNLVVTDYGANRVRAVAEHTGTFYGQPMTGGDIYTIAGNGGHGFSGDGGPATGAEFRNPNGVAVDAAGNVLIVDTYNNRVRAVAARTGTFYGQPMTAGDIYTVAGTGAGGFSGDGGPATAAELSRPSGVAVDGAGNLLLADSDNSRVRAVAARTGTFYGQPMTAGDIYTIAGTGTSGFSGDGGPATAAELSRLPAVAVDAAGNLLLADNNRIRVVAAATGTFYGQPMTAGDIYTIAGTGAGGFSGDGGPATAAELSDPRSTAVDAEGNLLITDTLNNRVRVVAAATGTFYGQPMTAGDIYTIAGTGTSGFSGDGAPATAAELSAPAGVAVDAAGDLLITDSHNRRIREVPG